MTTMKKMTKAQLQDRVAELEKYLRAIENHTCGLESQINAFQERDERKTEYVKFLEKENRELRDAQLLKYKKKEEESAKLREEHGCPQQ
jgi:exonuclease VII small subunit